MCSNKSSLVVLVLLLSYCVPLSDFLKKFYICEYTVAVQMVVRLYVVVGD